LRAELRTSWVKGGMIGLGSLLLLSLSQMIAPAQSLRSPSFLNRPGFQQWKKLLSASQKHMVKQDERRFLSICAMGHNSERKERTAQVSFRGVTRRAGGKYQASITSAGQRHVLGVFGSPQEAALAYDKAAREY
ncbi:unnamed protein product, partial [Chrysoparadoxa australica]